jgi:hypothetical protein
MISINIYCKSLLLFKDKTLMMKLVEVLSLIKGLHKLDGLFIVAVDKIMFQKLTVFVAVRKR